MKPKLILSKLAAPALALALFLPPLAQAQLEWRVSVKFILDANRNLPTRQGNYGAQSTPLTSHLAVTNQITTANAILDRSGRGYRYRLTEVVDLSGVSQWFDTMARSADNRTALENAATADAASKALYAWRDDAINVYINNSSSGVCSFPGDYHLIFLGSGAYNTILVHEVGHFFSLKHTHDGEGFQAADGSACSFDPSTDDPCVVCPVWVPNQGDAAHISDTLKDHECYNNNNQVALANYNGMTYASLTASQKLLVDNTWTNIMSYHLPQDRFTPDQLDRMTDASNDSEQRFYVATGRTRFVRIGGNDSSGSGSSTSPYRTLFRGVTVADAGDIVLLRGGNYNEQQTINKPITLRATRGSATIGRP